jgi:hypothetical protein
MRRRSVEAELGRRLREAPVPIDPAAEERVLEQALAEHAARRPTRRSPLPRLAVVLAVALALGALLLTPAWARVRDWVGDALETTSTRSGPAGLGPIPGGGRLLVQTAAGVWIVAPDGVHHLLRGYRQASWSPHGFYLAAVRGDRLTAVEPGGDPHWTLRAAGPVADPRWAPSGELIAYRSGGGLRLVAGDGSEDRALDDTVAPVAPAWDPAGGPDLAYVDARGALRVLDVASGKAAATAGSLPGIRGIEWAGSGGGADTELLEISAHRLRVRAVSTADPAAAQVGRARQLPVTPGATIRAAAISPEGRRVAALLTHRSDRPGQATVTDLVLYSTRTGRPRRLGSVPGRLADVAWSPGGERLLVAWPSFDEWLFVPPRGGEGRAMSGIRKAFRSGPREPFPAVAGWCCRARSAAVR